MRRRSLIARPDLALETTASATLGPRSWLLLHYLPLIDPDSKKQCHAPSPRCETEPYEAHPRDRRRGFYRLPSRAKIAAIGPGGDRPGLHHRLLRREPEGSSARRAAQPQGFQVRENRSGRSRRP